MLDVLSFTGCGDYVLKDISMLADPCPLPDKEKKRSLNEKERLVYAPMSGVGGVVYDKVSTEMQIGCILFQRRN